MFNEGAAIIQCCVKASLAAFWSDSLKASRNWIWTECRVVPTRWYRNLPEWMGSVSELSTLGLWEMLYSESGPGLASLSLSVFTDAWRHFAVTTALHFRSLLSAWFTLWIYMHFGAGFFLFFFPKNSFCDVFFFSGVHHSCRGLVPAADKDIALWYWWIFPGTTGHFLHRILGGISHKSNTPVHVECECTTATVMTYIFIYAGISPDTDLGNLLSWKKEKKEFWSHQILPHLNPLEFHICKTLTLKTGKKSPFKADVL